MTYQAQPPPSGTDLSLACMPKPIDDGDFRTDNMVAIMREVYPASSCDGDVNAVRRDVEWATNASREEQDDGSSILVWPSGLLFNPFNPDLDLIKIEDIALALSNACRYAGHISPFYSVAQHSVIVAGFFSDPATRLAALLHDAEEAYLGDMPSPYKVRYPQFVEDADKLRRAIYARFGVYDGLYHKVKPVDNEVYHRERLSLFGGKIDSRQRIVPLMPRQAEDLFLKEFHSLVPETA